MCFEKLMYPKPRIVTSRCLKGELVRYNAEILDNPSPRILEPFAELLPVCPEVQIGMPVPRPPIQIHISGDLKIHQPSTGRDFTQQMTEFCEKIEFQQLDGFLLKARSPSCGIIDTPHFKDQPSNKLLSNSSRKGAGLFTHLMKEKYSEIPFCDEDRFLHDITRDWFLTNCFLSARRRVEKDFSTKFDKLMKPQIGFCLKALQEWPKQLFEFYMSSASEFKVVSKHTLIHSNNSHEQMQNINIWRREQAPLITSEAQIKTIYPYPANLL